jgi:hypothetical protein
MAESIKKLRLALDELEKCPELERDRVLEKCGIYLRMTSYASMSNMLDDVADTICTKTETLKSDKDENFTIMVGLCIHCFGGDVFDMTNESIVEHFDWLFWRHADKNQYANPMKRAQELSKCIEKHGLVNFSDKQIKALLKKFPPRSSPFPMRSPQHRLLRLAQSAPWHYREKEYKAALKLVSMKPVANSYYTDKTSVMNIEPAEG